MAATGAVALFHVEGITPDARVFRFDTAGLEEITVSVRELDALLNEIPVDAVALGCPHCSPAELSRIAILLEGKRVAIPLYVFSARGVIERKREEVAVIERSGARVYADTCMVVSPAMEKYRAIMVNSGKAFSYVPNMCGGAVRLGTTEECIRVATGS